MATHSQASIDNLEENRVERRKGSSSGVISNTCIDSPSPVKTGSRAALLHKMAVLGEVPPVQSALAGMAHGNRSRDLDITAISEAFCTLISTAGFSPGSVSHARTTVKVLSEAASDVLGRPARSASDLIAKPVIQNAINRIRSSRSADRRLSMLPRLVGYLHTGRLVDRTVMPECEEVRQMCRRPAQVHARRPISLDPTRDHPLAQAFIRELNAQNRGWQKRAKYALRHFLRWLTERHAFQKTDLIDLNLSTVTREYLVGYYHHLEDRVSSGKLAIGTFRLRIQALRRWFIYLYVHGHIYTDASIALPVVKGREVARHRIVSRGEAKTFLEAVIKYSQNPLQDLAVFACLSGLGLRPSEAVNLRVGDIDRNAALMRVLGKGNKERLVPLPGSVLLSLERYLAARGPAPDGDPLWLGKLGAPLSYEELRLRFHKFQGLAGIDRNIGGPHVFRHYFITENLLNGADLEDLAALVGDDNIRSMQPYLHTTDAGIRAALLRAFGEKEAQS